MFYVCHHSFYESNGRLSMPCVSMKEAKAKAQALFNRFRDEVLIVNEAGNVVKQFI